MNNSEPTPGTVAPEAIKPLQPLTPQTPEITQPPQTPLLEEYRAKAQEVKIKPVQGGNWLATDGVEYTQWGDEKHKFPANTDEQAASTRLGQVGTYDSNNGTLAFVDEQGVIRVGHSTEENFQALEQAGYRRGGIWVPFSNGEVPTDPELRKQYTELREKGREINKQRNTGEHLIIYQQTAEKRGIKLVDGGLFVMVDGIEYRHFGNETGKIDVNTDGYNMAIRRVEQVGNYDSNNGRVAFVDEQGRMLVGACTDENFDVLQKAGYSRGGIWVPFSNGEIPTDRETYERVRDVLTGKPAEQLKAERTARVGEIIEARQNLFGEIAVLPDREELYVKVSDRAERQYVNEEQLVQERLQPRVEKDNAGFERRIYTVNGVTFSFKGREELPTYPTLTSSRTTFLGESPNWVEQDDFQGYQEQLKGTQAQEGSPQHFVANKSLLGVVELSIHLGSKDSTLSQLRDELRQGIYSQRARTMLDALVATNYADAIRWGGDLEANAEAVVLLSLLGDAQAQTAVAESVEALKEHEESKRAHREQRRTDYEPLKPQELCVVHATRYEPKSNEEGFLVLTTFDATEGKVLRNTVHTALNHKVADHMYGSWGDAGYVLVAPFERMMEANGVPTVLNTVDTYWAKDPGEPLVFADGTLIAPGGAEVSGLYEESDNVVKFKSRGLDTKDLIDLSDYAKKNGYLSDFSGDVDNTLNGALYPYGSAMEIGDQWDFGETQKAINRFLYHDDNAWGHEPALLGLLTSQVEGQPPANMETVVGNLLVQSGAAINGLKPEVQDREQAVAALAKTLSDRIKSTMFTEINELTVREVIRKQGFTVQPGGMWAWGDSWSVTSRTGLLGQELGVPVGAHTNMADNELTERFMGAISQATTEGERGKSKFNWTKYEAKFDDLVARIDPKSRRVLYASGLLTARE